MTKECWLHAVIRLRDRDRSLYESGGARQIECKGDIPQQRRVDQDTSRGIVYGIANSGLDTKICANFKVSTRRWCWGYPNSEQSVHSWCLVTIEQHCNLRFFVDHIMGIFVCFHVKMILSNSVHLCEGSSPRVLLTGVVCMSSWSFVSPQLIF